MGMKTARVHILVCKRRLINKEDKEMCDFPRTKEQDTLPQPKEQRDVDDLIFRDEREWLTSDR